jgi:hypothetical protein
MYHFSRSIYRELAPRVVEDEADPSGCRNKQRMLDACEANIRRLASEGRYFARPARTLFSDVRAYFAMTEQLRVWRVIECNMALAQEYVSRLPNGAALGIPRACRAHTRRGTPCQREPLPGRDYCPSHKHLEETFEAVETVEASLGELEGERDRELTVAA